MCHQDFFCLRLWSELNIISYSSVAVKVKAKDTDLEVRLLKSNANFGISTDTRDKEQDVKRAMEVGL